MAWQFPNLRTDAAGYVEGFTWGARILYGFAQHNWLIPGVTYTRHVLNDAGTVVLPYSVVPTPTGAQVTQLCAPATPSTTDAGIMQVLVDSKVSDRFDGCFTSAGISMLEWAMLINDNKLRNMANDQKFDIARKLTAAIDTTNSIVSSGDGYSDFLTAETKFWTTVGRDAKFALVSNEYYNELLKQNVILNLFGNMGLAQDAYVNGHVGEIAGIQIIRTGLPEVLLGAKAYLMDSESLHVAVPNSIRQIPIGWNIQGPHSASYIGDSPSFSEGIQYILESDAPSGIEYTWLHYYYGAFVIKDFIVAIISTETTVAGFSGVLDATTSTSVDLTWTASTDTTVTGYNIYQNNKLLTTVSGASSDTYTVTGLTPGQTYYFGITAVTANGESEMQTVTVAVPAATT